MGYTGDVDLLTMWLCLVLCREVLTCEVGWLEANRDSWGKHIFMIEAFSSTRMLEDLFAMTSRF